MLKKDTVIGIRIDQAVSSETAHVDDKISAKVSRDVIVEGTTAIPAGTRLEGTVVAVERPTPANPRGKLGIRFTSLVRADNSRVAIVTETISREAPDPNAAGGASFDVNAFSALVGANRAAPRQSGSGSSPTPAGPRDVQLSAGAILTVHLTTALSISIDRNPK